MEGVTMGVVMWGIVMTGAVFAVYYGFGWHFAALAVGFVLGLTVGLSEDPIDASRPHIEDL